MSKWHGGKHKDQLISKELLNELFEYRDGILYWKKKIAPKIVVGTSVGHLRNGYLATKINYVDYLNHRLIFMMHHGFLPCIVDHIDGNSLNNKIENLREADFCGNSRNSKKPSNNTSGKKGVYWKKDKSAYKVELWVNNKPKFFGYYKDFELACLVSDEARSKYHKEFARYE